MENIKKYGDLEIGLHWLQGVDYGNSESEFIYFAKSLDKVYQWSDIPTRMGKIYQRSGLSTKGVRVGYSLKKENYIEGFFSIPGSYLDSLNLENQYNLLNSLLLSEQIKLTRIDIAFNDYNKILTPKKSHSWANSGYFRGFRKHSSIKEEFHFLLGQNFSLGATKCFGRRASKKYLRIYEALPVHNKDAIRWELELRDDKARFTALFLQELGLSEIPKHICGSIDFVQNCGKRKNSSKRISKWEHFINYVGGSEKFSIPQEKTTFEKKVEWLFRQCSKNLAITYEVLGYQIIKEIINFGKSNISVLDE